MTDIGQGIADAFARFVIVVAVVCLSLGGLAVWGLPKLWDWVKPLVHSLTA